MAIVKAVTSFLPKWHDKAVLAVWTGMVNGDIGSALELPSYPDRSVQVTGTFGVGGSLQIQGSLDGDNWFPLNDPQGNALSIAAAKIESIQELARFMRPVVTAGDGDTALTVHMIIRRA